ncbi:protease HtpX [Dokdonella fugitiva]|jgi:heat shock protein HtpX|uniref:Protease HtpX n=1 Tax=Dokdonella fugitiva TaxID=328517 RepID=A0A4V2S2U5_9GAMM|nr:protease HtpX [Dokdonella fugitiva]MBA8883841.1 heat shock protein HtpX [Dokdonella fugitiva]TCO41830.1 heat shock protein HtpX [Dokdonella fugitiva]
MLRIVLFVLTNLAVMALLTIVVKLTGLDVYAYRRGGLNLSGLLVMAAVMGMGGSFISLAMSKWMAKMSVGAQVITQPRNAEEQWLLAAVRAHADKAGIGMPEVAIYDGPEMNAFATGMSKNSSLVAVSTGLLRNMDRQQVDAVLGHEITHVANGDMVTMALLQGVLNTFVIFLARVIGTLVDRAISGNRDGGGGGLAYFAIVMVLQLVLGLLASLIVMAFSRWREFRADAGGARLAGRAAMISALERLDANHGESTLPKAIQAFGISGEGGIARLFMSHPPIAERVAALRAAA